MRLFIAIGFDDEFVDALIGVQDQIWDAGIDGNYTKEENLHLTLAFIGECGDSDRVLDAMRSVPFSQFDLTLDGIGAFDGVWWAGLGGSDELSKYAARLRRALAAANVPFDKKRFSPHITLIRQPSRPAMPEVEVPAVTTAVKKISLMRSDRGRNGVIYTEIGSVCAKE